MSRLGVLIQRVLSIRIVRFGLVGGCAFVAYSLVMLLVVHGVGLSQVVGAFFGFIVGTVVSYIGNTAFVFKSTVAVGTALKFWVVTTAGLALNLLLAALLERAGAPPLLTAFLIFATIPIFNYVMHVLWTYRRTPQAESQEASRGIRRDG